MKSLLKKLVIPYTLAASLVAPTSFADESCPQGDQVISSNSQDHFRAISKYLGYRSEKVILNKQGPLRVLNRDERELYKGVGGLTIVTESGAIGSRGSAFLVNDCRTILTAGHTLVLKDGTPIKRFKFNPLFDIRSKNSVEIDLSDNKTSELKGAVKHTFYFNSVEGTTIKERKKRGRGDDFAVIRLANPVPGCQEGVTPLQIVTAEQAYEGIQAQSIGGADLMMTKTNKAQLFIGENCEVLERHSEKAFAFHSCSTADGNSGGPLVIPGTNLVVGLHISHQGRFDGEEFEPYQFDKRANIAHTFKRNSNILKILKKAGAQLQLATLDPRRGSI